MGWLDDRTVAYVYESYRSPPELFVKPLAGKPRQLTHSAYAAMQPASFEQPESVTWQSDDGVRVHGYLRRPSWAQPGEKLPGLLLSHTYNVGQFYNQWVPIFSYLVQSGYVVLQVNHRGSNGYGTKFRDLPKGNWGHAQLKDIDSGAAYLRALPDVDASRVGMLGYSMGGYMTQMAVTNRPDLFDAAVAVFGLGEIFADPPRSHKNYVWHLGGTQEQIPVRYANASPVTRVHQMKTPLLIIHSDGDPIEPVTKIRNFTQEMDEHGKKYELALYSNEAHGLKILDHQIDSYRCHAEKLVAFSCKRRGFCPSCGARRMTESAALLVEEVLPKDKPLRQWVLSLPFALRFLLARDPRALTCVLGIVYRCIAAHLIGKARLTRRSAHTGAVTFIQRFGSALNLNIHFHMLFLDGVYRGGHPLRFQPLPAPSPEELQALVEQIAEQIGRALERRGVLVREAEQAYLALESDGNAESASGIDDLLAHSITYCIASGPHAGQKVLTLQSPPPAFEPPAYRRLAQACGFSLHAGIAIGGTELEKLERLCRYISRPALATERLALTAGGGIRYTLKTPYRDGTTHVLFEPLDFLVRLAALVPLPRVHLTRFHGLFAPHSRLRALITPAGRGRTAQPRPPRHHALRWMQRLKRARPPRPLPRPPGRHHRQPRRPEQAAPRAHDTALLKMRDPRGCGCAQEIQVGASGRMR